MNLTETLQNGIYFTKEITSINGTKIAKTGYSNIYDIGDGKLLKVYHNSPEKRKLYHRYSVRNGLPSDLLDLVISLSLSGREFFPKIYDAYLFNGYVCFEMEKINGSSMLNLSIDLNETEQYAVLFQIVYALYSVKDLHFNHIDLHMGNILISDVDNTDVEYKTDVGVFKVPTCGFRVTIIDFGCSRITINGIEIFRVDYLNKRRSRSNLNYIDYNESVDLCLLLNQKPAGKYSPVCSWLTKIEIPKMADNCNFDYHPHTVPPYVPRLTFNTVFEQIFQRFKEQ